MGQGSQWRKQRTPKFTREIQFIVSHPCNATYIFTCDIPFLNLFLTNICPYFMSLYIVNINI